MDTALYDQIRKTHVMDGWCSGTPEPPGPSFTFGCKEPEPRVTVTVSLSALGSLIQALGISEHVTLAFQNQRFTDKTPEGEHDDAIATLWGDSVSLCEFLEDIYTGVTGNHATPYGSAMRLDLCHRITVDSK